MLDQNLLKQYLKEHPEVGPAGQARLKFLLNKVDNPDGLLKQALEGNVGPDKLMPALQKGIVQSRRVDEPTTSRTVGLGNRQAVFPAKKADDEVDDENENEEEDPDEETPESVPPTHPGQENRPPSYGRGYAKSKGDAPKTGKKNFLTGLTDRLPWNKDKDDSKEPKTEGTSLIGRTKDKVNDIFSNKWLRIGGLVVFGIIILLCALWFFGIGIFNPNAGYYTQTTQLSQSQPLEVTPQYLTKPSEPTQLLPIDLHHADWYSVAQYTIVLFWILILIGVGADAYNRHQMDDFFWLVAGVILVVAHKFFETLVVGFLGPGTWLNFNLDTQLPWVIALALTIFALASITAAALSGGLDLTPVAGFFTLVGGSALVIGNIGAFQTLFGIADSPVLPLDQTITLLSLKQYSVIGMSVATYVVLTLGLLLYIIEMIRTIVEAKADGWKKFLYAVTSATGLIVFFLFKNLLLSFNIPPFLVVIFCLMAAISAAFALRLQKKTDIPLQEGQVTLRTGWIPPFDKVAVQLAIGLLMITLTGRIV